MSADQFWVLHPVGTSLGQLEEITRDGVVFVPYTANYTTPELAEKRTRLGTFSKLMCTPGYHVQYLRADSQAVRALGRMGRR